MNKPITAVDVAKDALELIDQRKIRVTTGTYFAYSAGLRDATRTTDGGLYEVLKSGLSRKNTCRVCAIGSMLVACVLRKESDVSSSDFGWDRTTFQVMDGIMSRSQLRLMEVCFEMWEPGEIPTWNDMDIEDRARLPAAHKMGKRYKSDSRRLRAILGNIIYNKGVFDPTNEAPKKKARKKKQDKGILITMPPAKIKLKEMAHA